MQSVPAMSPGASAAIANVLGGGKGQGQGKEGAGGGAGRRGGQLSKGQKKKLQNLNREIDRLKSEQASSGSTGKGGKGTGKNKSGLHSHKDNQPICYKFAKDNACEAVCPFGRVHCCQICLGAHWNEKCEFWRAPRKGAGKGSRK